MNFLCYGVTKAFNMEEYRHINLLMLEGITEQKILNKVISIFHKYNNLEDRLNVLIHGNSSLQKIIDLATEMVEMPLNVPATLISGRLAGSVVKYKTLLIIGMILFIVGGVAAAVSWEYSFLVHGLGIVIPILILFLPEPAKYLPSSP